MRDASAVVPGDYMAASSTAMFAAGQTRLSVDIPIVADGRREPPEQFSLELVNPAGAQIAHGVDLTTLADSSSGDFGRDGRADLLLRHATTRELMLWSMDGADRVATVVPARGALADMSWVSPQPTTSTTTAAPTSSYATQFPVGS